MPISRPARIACDAPAEGVGEQLMSVADAEHRRSRERSRAEPGGGTLAPRRALAHHRGGAGDHDAGERIGRGQRGVRVDGSDPHARGLEPHAGRDPVLVVAAPGGELGQRRSGLHDQQRPHAPWPPGRRSLGYGATASRKRRSVLCEQARGRRGMQLKGATIAVTGATGFLGRYLVDTLLRRGARVVGVVRNPDRVPELHERGVELRRADLAERDRLAAGFRGADAVVSNAALLSLRNQPWSEYVRTNVDGTVNVCEAAAAAGVKRIVHVSSVGVYRGRQQRAVDEDHVQLRARRAAGAHHRLPALEGARGAGGGTARAAAPARAHRPAPERDLWRVRPQLHGGVPRVHVAEADAVSGLLPPAARLCGRRRRGARARARDAGRDRAGLQHHGRRSFGVGLRARLAAGGRAAAPG